MIDTISSSQYTYTWTGRLIILALLPPVPILCAIFPLINPWFSFGPRANAPWYEINIRIILITINSIRNHSV